MKPFWKNINELLACIWSILFIIRAFQQDTWDLTLGYLIVSPLAIFLVLVEFKILSYAINSPKALKIGAFININAVSIALFFK